MTNCSSLICLQHQTKSKNESETLELMFWQIRVICQTSACTIYKNTRSLHVGEGTGMSGNCKSLSASVSFTSIGVESNSSSIQTVQLKYSAVTESNTAHKISKHLKYQQYWIGLSSVLRPRQHSVGYMGDGFYRSNDPTNSIKIECCVQTTKSVTENIQRLYDNIPDICVKSTVNANYSTGDHILCTGT